MMTETVLSYWRTAWALLAGHQRFLVRGKARCVASRYACIWAKDQPSAVRRFASQSPGCAEVVVLSRL